MASLASLRAQLASTRTEFSQRKNLLEKQRHKLQQAYDDIHYLKSRVRMIQSQDSEILKCFPEWTGECRRNVQKEINQVTTLEQQYLHQLDMVNNSIQTRLNLIDAELALRSGILYSLNKVINNLIWLIQRLMEEETVQ